MLSLTALVEWDEECVEKYNQPGCPNYGHGRKSRTHGQLNQPQIRTIFNCLGLDKPRRAILWRTQFKVIPETPTETNIPGGADTTSREIPEAITWEGHLRSRTRMFWGSVGGSVTADYVNYLCICLIEINLLPNSRFHRYWVELWRELFNGLVETLTPYWKQVGPFSVTSVFHPEAVSYWEWFSANVLAHFSSFPPPRYIDNIVFSGPQWQVISIPIVTWIILISSSLYSHGPVGKLSWGL